MADLTYFWDVDRHVLRTLTYTERVEWVRSRMHKTLLKPIEVLAEHHEDAFVWLAITELICAGIESLGGFLGNSQFGSESPFCRFVHNFMHSDYSKKALDKNDHPQTYCHHLQKYFRHGLDHGFVIKWGGLWKANEPGFGGGYLRSNKDGHGIAVCPEELLADFRRGIDLYFARLIADGESSVIGKNFIDRFERIMNQKDDR